MCSYKIIGEKPHHNYVLKQPFICRNNQTSNIIIQGLPQTKTVLPSRHITRHVTIHWSFHNRICMWLWLRIQIWCWKGWRLVHLVFQSSIVTLWYLIEARIGSISFWNYISWWIKDSLQKRKQRCIWSIMADIEQYKKTIVNPRQCINTPFSSKLRATIEVH